MKRVEKREKIELRWSLEMLLREKGSVGRGRSLPGAGWGRACGTGRASTQQKTTKSAVLGAAGDTHWHRDQDILSFYVYEHQVYFNCHKIIKMFKLQN